KTETFAALKLEVKSWRWDGVPFYIRAGKCLPVTSTEILCRLRKPPAILSADGVTSNYLRIRVSPDVTIAMGMTVMDDGEKMIGLPAEMVASRQKDPQEMDAYERVLGDAMAGDATLFAREDYVEEAWRIVDPLLGIGAPVHPYDPHTWGPEAGAQIAPPGGWQNPVIAQEPGLLRDKAA
ncbi:MAG TPA: glucose-6-phosphate dehydrogenase, partial [Verrucomicrobiae bacterium]|nr:glucose-6-phosphate dehydrogenase [Verrucomicrobiae bacterium]